MSNETSVWLAESLLNTILFAWVSIGFVLTVLGTLLVVDAVFQWIAKKAINSLGLWWHIAWCYFQREKIREYIKGQSNG